MSAIATRPKIKQAPRLRRQGPSWTPKKALTWADVEARWTAYLAWDESELKRPDLLDWERAQITRMIELDSKMIAWSKRHGRQLDT